MCCTLLLKPGLYRCTPVCIHQRKMSGQSRKSPTAMEEVSEHAAFSQAQLLSVNKPQPLSTECCRLAFTSCAIHNTLCKMHITNMHVFLATISMHASTFASQQVNKVTNDFFALCYWNNWIFLGFFSGGFSVLWSVLLPVIVHGTLAPAKCSVLCSLSLSTGSTQP